MLYPRHEKHSVTKAKSGILNDTAKDAQKVVDSPLVNTLSPLIKRVRSVSKTELDRLRKQSAFRSIRQEWNNQRNAGRREKKAREAAEKK